MADNAKLTKNFSDGRTHSIRPLALVQVPGGLLQPALPGPPLKLGRAAATFLERSHLPPLKLGVHLGRGRAEAFTFASIGIAEIGAAAPTGAHATAPERISTTCPEAGAVLQ